MQILTETHRTRTAKPLEPPTAPGYDNPTSRCQTTLTVRQIYTIMLWSCSSST